MPLRACSSGMERRLSTSSVDRPGASVWISTWGGANSGNTSRGAFSSVRMPNTISTADSTTTTRRRRREVEISQDMRRLPQEMSVAEAEFRAAQLGGADGHHLGAGGGV